GPERGPEEGAPAPDDSPNYCSALRMESTTRSEVWHWRVRDRPGSRRARRLLAHLLAHRAGHAAGRRGADRCPRGLERSRAERRYGDGALLGEELHPGAAGGKGPISGREHP